MDFSTLIWLFVVFAAFTPALQRKYQEACRRFVIQRFEKKRTSRVITLIHRQETMSFLGITFSRYLDVDDSEQVLRPARLRTGPWTSSCRPQVDSCWPQSK